MKKQILTVVSLFLGIAVLAQNGNGNGNGNGTNSFPTNGNVGIGNTNPTEKLRVNGNVKVDSTMIVAKDATFESSARVDEDLRVNGQLYVPNMEEGVQIEDEKWVIISSEGQQKGVNKSIVMQAMYADECFLTDPSGNGGTVQSLPTWKSSIAAGGQVGYLTTGASCPAFVGVGTNAPLYHLDVRGKGYFLSGIKLGANYQQPDNAYIQGYSTYNAGSPQQIPWIRFMVNEGGTSNAAFVVNQDGGVYCNSLKIRLRNEIPVPDYVFKPTYDLMPLSEVKKYVQTFSHLPNVPSEDELRTNGLSIEEMQLTLLEKVEELTLYMIQLSEENEQLRQELNTLCTEIDAKND